MGERADCFQYRQESFCPINISSYGQRWRIQGSTEKAPTGVKIFPSCGRTKGIHHKVRDGKAEANDAVGRNGIRTERATGAQGRVSGDEAPD